MQFLFFKVPDGSVYHDTPDPSLKCALKLKLAYVLEYLNKGVLYHILSFHGIIGIPQAHAHHLACIPVEKHTLAAGILPDTAFDKFVFFSHLFVFW